MFLNISQTLSEACNFIKKETPTHVFCGKFCEILGTAFLYRTPAVVASEDYPSLSSLFNGKILNFENLFLR